MLPNNEPHMNLKKSSYFIFALSILSFNSCLEETEVSNLAEITEFYIPDQLDQTGLTNIEFTVTPPANENSRGLITNTTLFEYHTLTDSLIPILSSSMNNQAYWETTYIDDNGSIKDTVILVSSGSTKMLFNSNTILTVVAQDGFTTSSYDVIVNQDPVNPTQINWTENIIAPEPYAYTKAYRFNNTTWLISGELDRVTHKAVNVLYSSQDGVSWQTKTIEASSFPMGIDHTIAVYKNKVYSLGHLSIADDGKLIGKNEVWESTDGVSWIKSGMLPGDGIIFRNAMVLNNKLYLFGGSTITAEYTMEADPLLDADRSIHVFDGNAWKYNEALLPEDMPFRYGAYAVHSNKMFYLGGEKQNGICADQWVSQNGLYWIRVSDSKLNPIKKASLITYDNRLWLIGGETASSTNYTIQESKTEGLTWHAIEQMDEEQLQLSDNYQPRAGCSAFVDTNNKVWIIGGYNITDNVMTPLKDAWIGKMNKFNAL